MRCVADAHGRDLQGRGSEFHSEPIPPFLLERVHAGGLLPQLKRRLRCNRAESRSGSGPRSEPQVHVQRHLRNETHAADAVAQLHQLLVERGLRRRRETRTARVIGRTRARRNEPPMSSKKLLPLVLYWP